MIDLRNTCVLVRTLEENKMLLKEAEKQGFHWYGEYDAKPFEQCTFPDILKFSPNNIIYRRGGISLGYTFYEASELLGTKEMTAREFIKWYVNVDFSCGRRNCDECVLGRKNTKCNNQLCTTCDWKNNIDELLEIAESGRITVPTPEEKAISALENFIENPDRTALNDEFVESLKLAVEKLKEVKIDGEINT
jgi:hypothetical protein